MSKNAQNSTTLNEKTGRVGPVTTIILLVLSTMILINFVAFAVFKILLNTVSIQNLLNANNC